MRFRTFAILLVCCSVTGAVSTAWGDAVGRWHLDEAATDTIAQDAVGDVDGTISGAAGFFFMAGISGNALGLIRPGNGYMTMGNNFSFGSGDYTISVWMQTLGAVPDDTFVLAKHDAGHLNGYIFGVNSNPGGFVTAPNKAWFYRSSTGPNVIISTTDVTDGLWHHLVGVYRAGGNSRLYVDGAPAEGVMPSMSMATSNAPFCLGCIQVGGTLLGSYSGFIDEVQVFDHALTAAQAQFLFSNPIGTVIGPIGDLDCNRAVNFDDIDAFVTALANPTGYAEKYPGCRILLGDMNLDGQVNFDDIEGFVTALTET